MSVTETDISNQLSAEELLRLVYKELRHLAARKLAKEAKTQTLDATALVHEAYLRLMPKNSERPGERAGWNSRAHFFAAAAEAMRRILVEKARRRARFRHGREWRRIVLNDVAGVDEDARLLALDDALTSLKAEDLLAARVVELHHFAGLSHDLVSEVLQITVYQARQKWMYARAWLRDALEN